MASDHFIIIQKNIKKNKVVFGAFLLYKNNLIESYKSERRNHVLDKVADYNSKHSLHNETRMEYRILKNYESYHVEHLRLYEFMHKYIEYISSN